MQRVELKAGIAPSVQLKEQRAAAGNNWRYLPHQGAREKARRRRQIERAAAKAAEKTADV